MLSLQCKSNSQPCVTQSALLNVRPTHGNLNARRGLLPVDLLEQLVDVVLLGNEKRSLAVRDGLVEFDEQAAWGHISREPDPSLAIINDLVLLKRRWSALRCIFSQLHLLFEALHTNGDVLLADIARWRSLPEAGISNEALVCEFSMEVLHDHLCQHSLRRWATTASHGLFVELLDISIGDVVLAT